MVLLGKTILALIVGAQIGWLYVQVPHSVRKNSVRFAQMLRNLILLLDLPGPLLFLMYWAVG